MSASGVGGLTQFSVNINRIRCTCLTILFPDVCRVEAEYDKKLKDLQEKYAKEVAEFSSSPDAPGSGQTDGQSPAVAEEENDADDLVTNKADEEEVKERKLEKARRKREKQREKERERELQIERENAEAGPSLRDIEVEQIEQQLAPVGLKISEVTPDGNCLYRAVASHCGNTYHDVRKLNRVMSSLLPHGHYNKSSYGQPQLNFLV